MHVVRPPGILTGLCFQLACSRRTGSYLFTKPRSAVPLPVLLNFRLSIKQPQSRT
jgi:hypothetical protein